MLSQNCFLFFNPFSALITIDKISDCNNQYSWYSDSILLTIIMKVFKVNVANRCFDLSSDIGLAKEIITNAKVEMMFIGGTIDDGHGFINSISSLNVHKVNMFHIDGYDKKKIGQFLSKKNSFFKTPKIVVVGIGSPNQEILALKLARQHPGSLFFTCGGFITQTAKTKGKYYPRIIEIIKLRFIWRFINEPHVFSRTIKTYGKFVCKFIFNKSFRKSLIIGAVRSNDDALINIKKNVFGIPRT